MSPQTKPPLPPEALLLVANRFKILGDPKRLEILQSLMPGEKSVGEIVADVETSQPNVSKHLNILQRAGIVNRRQEGNTVYYRIADPSVYALCDLVCSRLQKQFSANVSYLSFSKKKQA